MKNERRKKRGAGKNRRRKEKKIGSQKKNYVSDINNYDFLDSYGDYSGYEQGDKNADD